MLAVFSTCKPQLIYTNQIVDYGYDLVWKWLELIRGYMEQAKYFGVRIVTFSDTLNHVAFVRDEASKLGGYCESKQEERGVGLGCKSWWQHFWRPVLPRFHTSRAPRAGVQTHVDGRMCMGPIINHGIWPILRITSRLTQKELLEIHQEKPIVRDFLD